VVVGGALARVALGLDVAIPLIVSSISGARPVAIALARSNRRIDQPGPGNGNKRLRRVFGSVVFPPPKSVDVKKICKPPAKIVPGLAAM